MMGETGITLVTLCGLLIGGFGIWGLRQPGANRAKSWLMVAAGAVIIFNVWINQALPVAKPTPASTR